MLTDDTPPLNFREAKKSWIIEYRITNSPFPSWREWSTSSYYETEKQRDNAFDVMQNESKTGILKFEYRKVDPERKTKCFINW